MIKMHRGLGDLEVYMNIFQYSIKSIRETTITCSDIWHIDMLKCAY